MTTLEKREARESTALKKQKMNKNKMALDSTTQREADSAEGSPLGDRDAEDIVGGAGTREGFTYASDEESKLASVIFGTVRLYF